MDRISVASKEYLHIPVAAPAGITLGSLPVEVALMTSSTSTPTEDDWHTADWDDVSDTTEALLLVGPGTGIVLESRRTYTLWVRITSDPEIPVIYSGEIATY